VGESACNRRLYPEKMKRIVTQIAVAGFSKAEVADGLDAFLGYLRDRPWLLRTAARWEDQTKKLVVEIEREDADVAAATAATKDEVWDCVIAAFNFDSEAISFDVIKSETG
jgi:hypothetical protein